MKTRTTVTGADTAQPKRGRPKQSDRRDLLIERYGAGKVKSLDGECGKPCEQLSAPDLESLYNHVSKEKGWGSVYRPAF